MHLLFAFDIMNGWVIRPLINTGTGTITPMWKGLKLLLVFDLQICLVCATLLSMRLDSGLISCQKKGLDSSKGGLTIAKVKLLREGFNEKKKRFLSGIARIT